MSQSGSNQYDLILTAKVDATWDEGKISKLGQTIADLSSKFDPLNLDENQKAELRKYGIDSVENLFTRQTDNTGNTIFKFSKNVEKLGTSALPAVIKEIQAYGRAMTSITKTTKKYAEGERADSRYATSYRNAINAGRRLNEIQSIAFGNDNVSSIFGDVVHLVSERYKSLEKAQVSALSRDVWGNILSEDKRLQKDVATLAKRRGVDLGDDNGAAKIIKQAMPMLGQRTMIDDTVVNGRRAHFAPLYQHAETLNEPNDIFRHKAIKELYSRSGEKDPGYISPIPESDTNLVGGRKLYRQIRRMQENGNTLAQKLALETGLAWIDKATPEQIQAHSNGHDEGLYMHWAANPTRKQLGVFLARAMQEGRQIKAGQGIYEHNPDNNYNVNKAMQEVIEISNAYAKRAEGKNGQAFVDRIIKPFGVEDLADLSWSGRELGKVTSVQRTGGRMPTYAIPYTVLREDAEGNLSFAERTRDDMQKITKSGRFIVSKNDEGILVNNSQLTKLLGLNKAGGAFGAGFEGSGHERQSKFPDRPVLVGMDVADAWARNEQGYLKTGKEKELTKLGELYEKSVESDARYGENDDLYQFIYSNSKSAFYSDKKQREAIVAARKEKGIDDPFYGYDPQTPQWYYEGISLKEANKLRTSAKRIGTQGIELSEINPTLKDRPLKIATFSVEAQDFINKELGLNLGQTIPDKQLVDGFGFINPAIAPFSFQARALGSNLKGVLGNYNWQQYIQEVVEKNPNAKSSPFITFDDSGKVSQFFMPSVAFAQIEDAKRKKGIVEAIRNGTEFEGLTRTDLISKYFENLLDTNPDILLEENMLKGKSKGTVKRLDDYVKFMVNNFGITEKEANERLEEKRRNGDVFNRRVGDDLIDTEFVRLNRSETNANLSTNVNDSGLFEVKSDEDFSTSKRKIGRQLAEAIGFNHEMKKRSAELYAQRFAEMEDADYWIERNQFADRADIHSRFEQAEDKYNFIKTDKQALEYIQDQKDALKKQQLTHYLVDNESATKVALPLLGSTIQAAIYGNGAQVKQSSPLAWTFTAMLQNPEFLKNNLGLSDEVINELTIKDGENKGKIDLERIMHVPGMKDPWAIGGRTPSALDTFSLLFNLASTGASLNSLQGGGGDTVMLSPDAMYRMNTGDFDGDTIWLYSHLRGKMGAELKKGLSEANALARLTPDQRKEIEDVLEEQDKELERLSPEKREARRQLEQQYTFLSGQGEMGKASALMRNALDLYDTNTPEGREKFARAYNLGSLYYDHATSQGQNEGWVGNYGLAAISSAALASRQFSRFEKVIADSAKEENEEYAQPSIFSHRLRSIHNIKDVAEALEKGHVRMDLGGESSGFGELVDDWIVKNYGVRSKGYSKTLFDFASYYGKLLAGQEDLSYLETRDNAQTTFTDYIKKLEAEYNRTTDADVKDRLENELRVIRGTNGNGGLFAKLFNHSSAGKGAQGEATLFSDVLEDMREHFAGTETGKMLEDAIKVNQNLSSNDLVQILQDSNHDALIEANKQEYLTTLRARKAFTKGTVGDFIKTWEEIFADNKQFPTTTMLEPYLRDVTALPVERVYYDENGEAHRREGYYQIQPEFNKTNYQKRGIENQMQQLMHLPETQENHTVFGSFVHDAFRQTIMQAEKERVDKGLQEYSYAEGNFRKIAKDIFDNGTLSFNGKQVAWKDYLKGTVSGLHLENPLSDEQIEEISNWLGSESDELLDLGDEKQLRLQQKLNDTFKRKGNKNEAFIRDLLKNGALFEAENLIYDKEKGEYIPYGTNQNMYVNDVLGERGEKTKFRPDMLWSLNGNELTMFDWKPSSEAAEESIYQMIKYAKQAEIESKRVHDEVNAKTKSDVTREQAIAGLSDEDKRWYQFRDDEDKFKIKTLRGVDYTGIGDDIIFNYAQHPELVNQVVNGDFKAALERFMQDRKGAGILKGFDYMLSSGLVSREDDIDETLKKYLGNVDRYSQLEDAIKEFRETPSHIRSGSDTFKGQDFIADHSQEWDFLVARYAQNRSNLDQIMEKLHSSNSKYRSKALTNFEYSQFDALYDDMSKLEDPEMLTALRAVYKDVLPVALQDIDEYDIRKGQGKALLDSIVENASILDPMLTEEALRRQLYGSKGSNVYDRVRSVISQANASAGIRQSLKKPYEKFFESAKSFDEKEDVWARAGAIELEANKYASNDKSAKAEEARKARANFIAELRSQHSSVFTGKNRINADEFMMSAARFAEAESAVGKLRQTEANLISKIFENDLNQIDRTVNRLTGKKETPGPKFLSLIEDKKQVIDDQIQSYIMDNSETDRIAQDYIKKISTKNNPENFKKSVKAAYEAGNAELLKTLSESAKDNNSKDAIAMLQHLVAKKNKTSDVIKILGEADPVSLYMKDMGKTMGKAAMSGITSPFKMLYNQFSRRVMMSAISEIQNFVKQYNAAMTEIQMITLKSNEQINQLGSGLIDLAKDLKVSVSDITSSAAALYRQGLSDEEVNERLKTVTKFSKVSGTKVTDATKLITTAMNTGLVDSAQEAADVVTILGDSAATNAAQIEKGVEKAGAAAAIDGTSFGELTALLTAITATTQVTGNVAGTTLNSVFGRMNKVGMNDLIYDENGKAISGSDIATLLRAQGIDYQDENGKKRSTFAILKDLSQSYDTMSDLEQRQLATAIAGTRQYSNFGAIMTAFKEGEMDRYMDLLGNAEGITDKKYDVYLKSLNASLTELRSTFDGLVADLTDSGVLTSVINFLTGAIQGVDNLSKSAGGLAAALMPVVAIMAGMGLMKMGGLGFVAGAALVGGGLLAANFAGKSVSATEKYQEDKTAALEYTESWNDKIKRARDLNSRRNTLSEEEKNELGSLTKELAAYASVGSSADDAATSLQVLKGAIDLVGDSAANTSKVIEEAKDKNNKRTARDIFEGQNSQAAAIAETVRNFEKSFGTTEDTVAEALRAENFFIKDNKGRYTYNEHFDWDNWDNNNISYENFNALAETLGYISQGFTSDELKGYANYSKEDWKTALFNPQLIPKEVYDALALYYSAIGSEGKSDQLKDVLNTSITSLLTGVVPDEDLYNVVGGLTDKIVGSVLDENGSLVSGYEDIISGLLREVYGFDITDPYNLFNLDNLYKRIGNYGKASAKHDSSYVGTVTYNGKEYGSYADAYEQYSKDHPIEQADYNPNDVSETSELFYKSPNYDKDSGVGHILKANDIEAFKNSEDVVADFLDEINQGEKREYTKEQLDILFDEFLSRNTQKRWRDSNTGLAHTTKEAAIRSAIANSEVSSQYNGEYYSNDEEAEAQRRSDFEKESTFNDIEGTPKKEKAKQTASAFYTDYHRATTDEKSGYNSKNGTTLAVDAIVSELLSGEYGNGVEGLNNFIKTVETDPNLKLAWNKAIENQAIQNLLDTQVSFDETTGLAVSSPEDIIDQLIRTGMSNGLIYKEQTLSTKQQAKLAQNAYTNLQNGSTLASSEVRKNLIQAAQEEADNAEKELNQLLNQDSLNFTGNQLFANQRRINTAQEKLRLAQNTTALSPEEVSAIQNMYGVNLANKMISGQRLTDIEQNYVNAVDKTRSKGLTDFTTSQKLTNLKEARRLAKEARTKGAEITEEEILADYLSGMSNARDYLDLTERRDIEAGKEGALTNEEIQRLAAYEAELDSLETEYEVTIKTQGLESLEKAGKLLEGTVDLIGQLKKGGKFAIEASVKLTSDLQQQAQYDAMLNSDNIQLQNEALEALSGQKVTAENRARLMKQTKEQRGYAQVSAANTILKAYQTGEYTLEQAEQAGYSPIYDGISNYTLPKGFYIGENGDVYRSATRLRDEFQTRIKNSKSRGSVIGFRYTGNEYSPDNPFYGTEKNYTDAELAQMRQNILNGSLTATQEGYATALQSGGEEWQEYQRLVANRQTAIDEAKRAYKQDTVAYEAEVAAIDARIEEQKARAEAEEALSAEDVDNAETLRNLRLNSNTVGGAFAYAQERYRQNNKAGIAADQIFSSLSSDKVKSFDDLMDSVNGANASSWKDLLNANPDNIVQKLESLGASISDEGIDFSGVEESGHSLDAVLQILRDSASGASTALQGFRDVLSPQEMKDRAAAYMNGEYTGENEATGYAALSSLIQNEEIAQLIRNNVLGYGNDLNSWQNQYGQRYNDLTEKLNNADNYEEAMRYQAQLDQIPQRPTFNPNAWQNNVNPMYDWYVQSYVSNGLKGGYGLTDEQRYQGLNYIQQSINNGTLNQLIDNDNVGMIKDLTSGIEGFEAYAQVVKDMETTYKDVTDENERFDKALKKNKTSAESFNKTGLNLRNVLKNMAGDLKSVGTAAQDNASDYQKLNKTIGDVANNQYYKQRWQKGKRDKETIDYVKELAGLDNAKDSEVKKGKFDAQIEAALDFQESADIESLQNQANTFVGDLSDWVSQYFDGQTLNVDGPVVEVSPGVYSADLSSMVNGVTGEVNAQIDALVKALQAAGIDAEMVVDTNGDHISAKVVINNVRKAAGSGAGGGRKSGGGGGGGKSAAQTAIDAAKHAVSQAEHAANLAEANIYHPDKVNNFGGYIAAVQANIGAQQSLAETQRQQIAMLEAQRAATEYASDDWWSLTEAINGYEESLAKLEETIDSINQKILEEAKEQYGYQISAHQHGINMSSIDRTFYQRTNNYDAEEDTIDNLIEKNNALADSYFEALATYQGLANAEFAVNGQSDYWWSIQQEIDSTTESLAELKNTIDELNAEKIQIIIERQENEDKPENNAFSMMDLYKSRYQNTEDYTAYYTLMAERKQLTEEAIAQNRSQVAELEAQLAKYRIGSDEWIETRDQIWSIKLDTATKENELVDLEIELAEQRLAQLTQNYDRETAYMNHANTMYDTYSQMYEKVDNNAGYRSALSNQIEMFEQLRDSAIKARDAALQEMATLGKGTKEWYAARDAAYQYAEAAAQAYATGLEKRYAIEESYANELIEGYNNRMSITNQPIKLLQDEEKAYSTVSDYDSYIGAIRKEIELLTEQAAEGEKTIEQLKAQLEETTKGTPAWENLRKEILSVEQSVSSLQNSILDKNYEIEKSLGAQLRETFNDASAITNQQIKFAQDSQRVYSGVSNYDSLIGSYQEEIKFEKESIEQKKEYIEQQKALLAQTTKGTAEWKQKRSEILSLEQQISATENSILEKTYAIETARATQLREQYSERAAIPTQELKLNQVQEGIYGMFGDTSGQIASYQKEIDITAELLSQKREQVAQQKELLAQMTKGTTGWKQQREEILATEQSIASLESSMAQNQLKIEASLASDLQESYSNDMSVYGQAMSLMENNIKLASSHNDYEGYLTGLRSERELVSARQASQAEYLDALKDRLSNTTINTTTWKNLRKQILDVEKALSDTGVELDNIEQKIGTSKIDFYLEAMDRAQRERDHAITMAEYEMTRYQNAGEWTNYGIMLEKVAKKREEDAAALEKDIALLKEQLNQTDKSTKEYQRLIEQIEKKEETLAKDNNTIAENNKLLKENQDRIRKTRITLEEMVETEIKKRIEQEKAELNATVDLQNDVLDVIRQRYKDEWDLIKKDVDKKKEAMGKEKSLINERLQARKDAIDKESKYEELRELQNQLALISSDPTRSRDAAEVRKRINELNKDISMDIATDEADSATERIDEQIQAMEDWVSLNEENLNEMLEDARNFSEEVTGVLGGSYEQFMDWMSLNNTKFVESLDEARQKMDTDWKETWDTMTGYVETYRKEIDETLTSVENFVNFMSQSRDYIYATSETEQEQMISDWIGAYEDMESALETSDEALGYQFHEHDESTTDDVADQIEKGMTNALQNYDNSSWWGSGLQGIIPSVLTGDYDGSWFNTGIESKPETIATRPYDNLWTALGLEPEVESTRTQSGIDYDDSFWESGREPEVDTMVDEAPEVDSYDDLGLPEPTTAKVPTIEEFKDLYKDVGVDMSDLAPSEWVNKNKYVTEMPSYSGSYGGYSGGYGGGSGSGSGKNSGGPRKTTETTSEEKKQNSWGVELNTSGVAVAVRYTDDSGTLKSRKEAESAAAAYNDKFKTQMKNEIKTPKEREVQKKLLGKTTAFAAGGLVDYTGPAWVDGTPTKPESFLDAEDTANVRAMLDAFNYIKSPVITVPNRDWFGSSSTVGDINITINQAELKDDADYDEVAKRVGQSFVKQLSKNGLNLNGYSF